MVMLWPSVLSRSTPEAADIAPTMARINCVRAMTSSLELQDSEKLLVTSRDWVAEVSKRRCLHRYPVSLDPSLCLSNWEPALSEKSLAVYDVTCTTAFHFHLGLKYDEKRKEEMYQILDANNREPQNLLPLSKDEASIQDLFKSTGRS